LTTKTFYEELKLYNLSPCFIATFDIYSLLHFYLTLHCTVYVPPHLNNRQNFALQHMRGLHKILSQYKTITCLAHINGLNLVMEVVAVCCHVSSTFVQSEIISESSLPSIQSANKKANQLHTEYKVTISYVLIQYVNARQAIFSREEL
jgi:hypothetical protein